MWFNAAFATMQRFQQIQRFNVSLPNGKMVSYIDDLHRHYGDLKVSWITLSLRYDILTTFDSLADLSSRKLRMFVRTR